MAKNKYVCDIHGEEMCEAERDYENSFSFQVLSFIDFFLAKMRAWITKEFWAQIKDTPHKHHY